MPWDSRKPRVSARTPVVGVGGVDDGAVGVGDALDVTSDDGGAGDDGSDTGQADDAGLAVFPDLVEEAVGLDGALRVEGAVGGRALDAAQDGEPSAPSSPSPLEPSLELEAEPQRAAPRPGRRRCWCRRWPRRKRWRGNEGLANLHWVVAPSWNRQNEGRYADEANTDQGDKSVFISG